MNKLQKTLLGQIHNYKYNKLIIFDKKEDILKQLSVISDKFKIKHVVNNKSIEQYNNTDSLIIYVIDKKSSDETLGKMAININENGNIWIYDQKDNQRSEDFLLDRFEPISEVIKKILKGYDFIQIRISILLSR